MKNKYKIEGMSCASCALKFEENVKQLDGVEFANVNFGAGIIEVTGETSIEEITKAGAFEKLVIKNYRDQSQTTNKPLLLDNWNVVLSIVFFVLALFTNRTNHSVSVILFLSSIIFGGFTLFIEGFKDLFKFNFTMQTLMTIAIIGATVIGEWAEGAVVVLLFSLSEALEKYSMDKARKSITSLMNVVPKTAVVIRDDQEIDVDVSSLVVGDIIIVKPGQQIPMDGEVVFGESTINQAAITGESLPVAKVKGDHVFAGTLNEEGYLKIIVSHLVEDNTISKIINLVENAQNEKAPAQKFVDAFARYYTPSILILSVIVIIVPPFFLVVDWSVSLYQGLSLLVVGCPCSLVISTPVSIVSAISNAAKQGVLIKGGIHLEELGNVNAIAFDKTGTLTRGIPEVTDIYGNEVYLSYIAALEKHSQHPLANAVISMAEHKGINFLDLEILNFTSLTGKGIQGDIDHLTYYVGSPKMFFQQLKKQDEMNERINLWQGEGKTVIVFGTFENVLTIIAIADQPRESSYQVIEKLEDIGIMKTVMLTGDNQITAEAIANNLGIDVVMGDLLPEQKLEAVQSLKNEYSSVAMVGDGVNDAPALALSNVGITLGGAGTDTAIETADIVLMGDDLSKLPFTIKLSRMTSKVIKQNISFSLLIKLIAVLLIIPGWLTLWLAIVADMGATLLVTLNGMRLTRIK
ncbi:cadmium-translocating P-type ATPase [Erysipelothrix sp. HDW6B]|uniref:heavy metal translocating P-type ATPase n=1 Tax=Erysipelothrix sp. HDW6B TaxID=2714929 RepID=UPI0014094657|nr:heavy metal translocating P-type ATPase [Erysipelothrix sp. HDW6B]QIK86347.1 cadmium-translocating P-type ATPase [Erysipelothrix sp. HDW6B]